MKLVIMSFLVVVVFIVSFFFVKNKKKSILKDKNEIVIQPENNLVEDSFIFESFPIEEFHETNALVEIKDNKLLAKINNIVPEAAKSVNSAANAINDNKEVLYKVIIPSGAKLSKSRDMEGAVRAIYRDSKNIKGQANLVAVEKGGAVAANVASSAMNVASMVVGQYYMAQINDELGSISNNVDKIINFQTTEYKSKVQSLATQVKKIASFEIEILENEQLRKDEIQNLNRLEGKCTELLGQANLSIAEFQKKKDISYEEYQNCLKDAKEWYVCQNILVDVLYAISELRYALYMGKLSKENSYALTIPYIKQVEKSLELLSNWHIEVAKKLNIDIDKETIKRSGFDGVVHFIPGLFNNDQKFKSMPKETVGMIKEQLYGGETRSFANERDYYNENTQIVFKDGKAYLLPNTMEDE